MPDVNYYQLAKYILVAFILAVYIHNKYKLYVATAPSEEEHYHGFYNDASDGNGDVADNPRSSDNHHSRNSNSNNNKNGKYHKNDGRGEHGALVRTSPAGRQLLSAASVIFSTGSEAGNDHDSSQGGSASPYPPGGIKDLLLRASGALEQLHSEKQLGDSFAPVDDAQHAALDDGHAHAVPSNHPRSESADGVNGENDGDMDGGGDSSSAIVSLPPASPGELRSSFRACMDTLVNTGNLITFTKKVMSAVLLLPPDSDAATAEEDGEDGDGGAASHHYHHNHPHHHSHSHGSESKKTSSRPARVPSSGHGRLHLILGTLYRYGLGGLVRSPRKSLLHYTLAAREGVPEGHQALAHYYLHHYRPPPHDSGADDVAHEKHRQSTQRGNSGGADSPHGRRTAAGQRGGAADASSSSAPAAPPPSACEMALPHQQLAAEAVAFTRDGAARPQLAMFAAGDHALTGLSANARSGGNDHAAAAASAAASSASGGGNGRLAAARARATSKKLSLLKYSADGGNLQAMLELAMHYIHNAPDTGDDDDYGKDGGGRSSRAARRWRRRRNYRLAKMYLLRVLGVHSASGEEAMLRRATNEAVYRDLLRDPSVPAAPSPDLGASPSLSSSSSSSSTTSSSFSLAGRLRARLEALRGGDHRAYQRRRRNGANGDDDGAAAAAASASAEDSNKHEGRRADRDPQAWRVPRLELALSRVSRRVEGAWERYRHATHLSSAELGDGEVLGGLYFPRMHGAANPAEKSRRKLRAAALGMLGQLYAGGFLNSETGAAARASGAASADGPLGEDETAGGSIGSAHGGRLMGLLRSYYYFAEGVVEGEDAVAAGGLGYLHSLGLLRDNHLDAAFIDYLYQNNKPTRRGGGGNGGGAYPNGVPLLPRDARTSVSEADYAHAALWYLFSRTPESLYNLATLLRHGKLAAPVWPSVPDAALGLREETLHAVRRVPPPSPPLLTWEAAHALALYRLAAARGSLLAHYAVGEMHHSFMPALTDTAAAAAVAAAAKGSGTDGTGIALAAEASRARAAAQSVCDAAVGHYQRVARHGSWNAVSSSSPRGGASGGGAGAAAEVPAVAQLLDLLLRADLGDEAALERAATALDADLPAGDPTLDAVAPLAALEVVYENGHDAFRHFRTGGKAEEAETAAAAGASAPAKRGRDGDGESSHRKSSRGVLSSVLVHVLSRLPFFSRFLASDTTGDYPPSSAAAAAAPHRYSIFSDVFNSRAVAPATPPPPRESPDSFVDINGVAFPDARGGKGGEAEKEAARYPYSMSDVIRVFERRMNGNTVFVLWEQPNPRYQHTSRLLARMRRNRWRRRRRAQQASATSNNNNDGGSAESDGDAAHTTAGGAAKGVNSLTSTDIIEEMQYASLQRRLANARRRRLPSGDTASAGQEKEKEEEEEGRQAFLESRPTLLLNQWEAPRRLAHSMWRELALRRGSARAHYRLGDYYYYEQYRRRPAQGAAAAAPPTADAGARQHELYEATLMTAIDGGGTIGGAYSGALHEMAVDDDVLLRRGDETADAAAALDHLRLAFQHYKTAADMGHARALYAVAVMYQWGLTGAPPGRARQRQQLLRERRRRRRQREQRAPWLELATQRRTHPHSQPPQTGIRDDADAITRAGNAHDQPLTLFVTYGTWSDGREGGGSSAAGAGAGAAKDPWVLLAFTTRVRQYLYRSSPQHLAHAVFSFFTFPPPVVNNNNHRNRHGASHYHYSSTRFLASLPHEGEYDEDSPDGSVRHHRYRGNANERARRGGGHTPSAPITEYYDYLPDLPLAKRYFDLLSTRATAAGGGGEAGTTAAAAAEPGLAFLARVHLWVLNLQYAWSFFHHQRFHGFWNRYQPAYLANVTNTLDELGEGVGGVSVAGELAAPPEFSPTRTEYEFTARDAAYREVPTRPSQREERISREGGLWLRRRAVPLPRLFSPFPGPAQLLRMPFVANLRNRIGGGGDSASEGREGTAPSAAPGSSDSDNGGSADSHRPRDSHADGEDKKASRKAAAAAAAEHTSSLYGGYADPYHRDGHVRVQFFSQAADDALERHYRRAFLQSDKAAKIVSSAAAEGEEEVDESSSSFSRWRSWLSLFPGRRHHAKAAETLSGESVKESHERREDGQDAAGGSERAKRLDEKLEKAWLQEWRWRQWRWARPGGSQLVLFGHVWTYQETQFGILTYLFLEMWLALLSMLVVLAYLFIAFYSP